MLRYPHFAIPNLYLRNGYVFDTSAAGESVRFESEGALEDCVRSVLIHRPGRLNGPQFRFLRRGLRLSQAEFGKLIERDEQTIARIEKDRAAVPAMVDMSMRAHFLAVKEPGSTVRELVSLIVERTAPADEKIVLTYVGNGMWVHHFEGPSVQLTAQGRESFLPSEQGFSALPPSAPVLIASSWATLGETHLSYAFRKDAAVRHLSGYLMETGVEIFNLQHAGLISSSTIQCAPQSWEDDLEKFEMVIKNYGPLLSLSEHASKH